MEQNLPRDELSTAIGRIKGLLLTEEKVGRAAQILARAIKDATPSTLKQLSAELSAELTAGTPAGRD